MLYILNKLFILNLGIPGIKVGFSHPLISYLVEGCNFKKYPLTKPDLISVSKFRENCKVLKRFSLWNMQFKSLIAYVQLRTINKVFQFF